MADIKIKNNLPNIKIRRQPDDDTCGPTCLHSIYGYFNDNIPLRQVITEIQTLETGGTLAVFLALHALKRGYHTIIYNYNLELFDPSWFGLQQLNLAKKLMQQAKAKSDAKLHTATHAYLKFLRLGGELGFETLDPLLFKRYFNRGLPILAALSATFLYLESRVRLWDDKEDDIRGVSAGHFVVLHGYDERKGIIHVADPLHRESDRYGENYTIDVHRVIDAILLGVLSHDANLLILQPKTQRAHPKNVTPKKR